MTRGQRTRGLRVGFQIKIVIAVVAVALVPLVWTLAVGQGFLSTAISQGLNTGIQRDLERGFAVRREWFDTVKALFRRHADVFARDVAAAFESSPNANDTADSVSAHVRQVLERALDAVDDAARLQVLDHDGRTVATASRPERLGRERRLRIERRDVVVRGPAVERTFAADADTDAGAHASAPPRRTMGPARFVLVATFGVDWERFREFDRAGQRLRVYSVLRRRQMAATLVGVLKAQLVLLPFAVLASVALAWMVSRGVTGRVKTLRAATARVGQGDLTVRVEARGNDEIGDLVTAFNEMVQDMQVSRARIEYLQRIGAWQEFARRLAHEIKNPLTPIQLAIQEVAKKYEGGDPAFAKRLETAREVIEEEIETLRRLVAAFSEFAKLPDASLQPDDLAAFVRESGANRAFLEEAAARGEDASRHVEVHFEADDAVLPVRIDRVLLRRVIDNLVRNATEAGARTVWVRCAAQGRFAKLVVEDDGPGVPENVRHRVFEPYYTTKATGSGLGLSIVRKLAIDHHGDVVLEERLGGGAKFEITLPIVDPQTQRPSIAAGEA